MMNRELAYKDVSAKLLDAVPELSDKFGEEVQWQGSVGGKPGQYDTICFVLKPFLRNTLTLGDSEVLTRIFRFLEEMATSSDIQVVNLLQVGLFEGLVGDADNLAKAWKYMGDETKEVARQTARIRHREQNLPKA